jgi:aspartate/methionine/tyrosine aminotransferase
MKKIMQYTREELVKIEKELSTQYKHFVKANLNLDLSRGKPATSQLDLSNELLDKLNSYLSDSGIDARNYGGLEGLPECRKLFAGLLDLDTEQIIIGGNSSLNMMYDNMARLCLFGTRGEKPWKMYEHEGKRVKFLCPVPGYDRHFAICEKFGIEMVSVPLTGNGPEMNIVEKLVAEDSTVKGMWCVPLHSNPQGVCYSDETVNRLASMKTAAKDFSIFWDNAYAIHHIYEEVSLRNVFDAAKEVGNENRIYYFFSTSKVSFPGAGVALIASGLDNIAEIRETMSVQTLGYDKINQLRHVQKFETAQAVLDHMKLHAKDLEPKFSLTLHKLEAELKECGFASWSSPRGGYFISLYTFPGCAKDVFKLAEQVGVKLTKVGATFPYGQDPEDSNIRIAPSYPSLKELDIAMDVLCLCVKLATVSKLLNRT